jgi:hypothetical protein
MAATHHGFNILKIPGANGTITMPAMRRMLSE